MSPKSKKASSLTQEILAKPQTWRGSENSVVSQKSFQRRETAARADVKCPSEPAEYTHSDSDAKFQKKVVRSFFIDS